MEHEKNSKFFSFSKFFSTFCNFLRSIQKCKKQCFKIFSPFQFFGLSQNWRLNLEDFSTSRFLC